MKIFRSLLVGLTLSVIGNSASASPPSKECENGSNYYLFYDKQGFSPWRVCNGDPVFSAWTPWLYELEKCRQQPRCMIGRNKAIDTWGYVASPVLLTERYKNGLKKLCAPNGHCF